MGENFTQKLREINKELGINEHPLNSGMTEIGVIQKENAQNLHIGEVMHEQSPIQNSPLAPSKVSQPLKTHATVLDDATNCPHVPMHAKYPSQTKWKRLVREPIGTTRTQEESIGSKRPSDMVIDPSELPCKKISVSHKDKKNFQIMAEAVFQPCQTQ